MKNGLSLFCFEQLDGHFGADGVGLLAVFAVGGEPARRAAERGRRPGVSVKILGSSSLSRPRGLNFAIQEGGSSRPSVPICVGTP